MKNARRYGVFLSTGICVLTAYVIFEGHGTSWLTRPHGYHRAAQTRNASTVHTSKLWTKLHQALGFGWRPSGNTVPQPAPNLADTDWRANKTRFHPNASQYEVSQTDDTVYTNRAEEYALRLLHVEAACHARGTPQITRLDADEMFSELHVEYEHAILYCNIAKVASTFWKRLLTAMKSRGRYTSPFQMRLDSASLMTFQTLRDKLSEAELKQFLRRSYSFMFVRDPYARLFSGYENKIYQPNMLFWRSIGRNVVKQTRVNASAASVKFGHDVTFLEFVRFILAQWKKGRHIDNHFSPMNERCDPCSMPYSFIGKLETFKNDADYLLQLWRTMYPNFTIKFDDFEKETAMDTARGHIRFLFRAWETIKHHVDYPFYNLLQRTWSDNHIRGFLSKDIPLPFSRSEISNLTRSDVEMALQRALEIPANRTEVKLQREEALIQAYRTVPLEYMEKLRLFLLKDCQLFGYDDRPQKLFNRTQPYTNTHIYMKGI